MWTASAYGPGKKKVQMGTLSESAYNMASWPLALLVVLLAGVGYYLVKIQLYKNLQRRNGCESARKYPAKDPIFGLDLFLEASKMFSEHTFFPELFKRYRENGSTFETKTLGTPTICSCEPENLQSVFATNARNWGVSYRLPALGQYCGKGFLTTDGAQWERSRQLFSHSFVKANITDHTDYEHYVSRMMDRVPKDGSTVDLQHLIFSLVSPVDRYETYCAIAHANVGSIWTPQRSFCLANPLNHCRGDYRMTHKALSTRLPILSVDVGSESRWVRLNFSIEMQNGTRRTAKTMHSLTSMSLGHCSRNKRASSQETILGVQCYLISWQR